MYQMPDRHHRMVPDHAGASKAHDFFDALAHLGFITVDWAVLAGRFFNSKGTFIEAVIGVIPQLSAFLAQGFLVMVIPAINADHR